MKTKEVVAMLRTTKTLLLKLVHEGKLPANRVGSGKGEYRFLKSEIIKFLQKRGKPDNE